jgi:hypothetical protein
MNLKPNWNSWEGPNLIVTNFCNRLKKKGYDKLRLFPSYTTEVQKFRGAPVCMDIAKLEDSDGQLVFLIRGRVPYGGFIRFDGFIMKPDNTWKRNYKDSIEEKLKTIIDSKSPKIPL